MKKISILLIALLFGNTIALLAQSPKDVVTIASPNSTSLGSFGESPTSLYSGTTTVPISLYELKEGSLTLPISLNYNTSGVRPDQHPGWVGTNWGLNAGGMITRVSKGIPDETAWQEAISFSTGDNFTSGRSPGHTFNFTKLQSSTWNTDATIKQWAKDENWVETEADEFIFNFAGYSGKFYRDENGNWQVLGQPGFKIEFELAWIGGGYYFYLASPAFQNTPDIDATHDVDEIKIWGFRITTPDGAKYDFGLYGESTQTTSNFSIEASIGFFEEAYLGESWDSWYLRKITSADGLDQITFSYDMGDPVASFGKTIAMDKKQGSNTPKGILGWFGPVSASSFSVIERYDGRMIYPLYLKNISSKNFDINFTRSVTNELKYNYTDILGSLFNYMSGGAYSPAIHSFPARLPIAGRWIDFLTGKPEVMALTRTDINTSTLNSNGAYYYNNYFLEYPQANYYTGLAYDPNFIPSNYPFYIYEVIDFSKLKWYKLDKIEVKNKKVNSTTTELVKQYNLSYSSSSSQRLMLLSVQEVGKGGVTNPPYTFEYEDYNSNYYTGSYSLPPYNSYKVDHWGFYNGTDPTIGLDLTSATSMGAFKAKKDAVAQYLYSGVLNKITYPTGGFSKFTYEPNWYDKVVVRNTTSGAFSLATESKMAGGLRIKQIQLFAGYDQPDVVKTYEYYGGILNGESKYYWQNYQGRFASNDAIYSADRFVTQTILPVSSNGAGTHIGYSKVIERTSGNGYVEYNYANFDTNMDENFIYSIDPEKTPYSPFTEKDFERGKLTKTTFYNESNKILKEEILTYAANPNFSGAYARAVATKQVLVFDGLTIEGTAYKVYTYPYNLSSKTTKVYDQNSSSFVSTINQYTYNGKNFLRQDRLTSSSDASILDKINYYVSDYSTSAMNGIIGTMQGNNIFTPIVDSRVVRNSKVVEGKVNEFNSDAKVINEYLFESATPQTISFSSSAFNPNTTYYKKRTNYFYDLNHERLSCFYTTGDEPKSFQWGYNNLIPIVEVRNALNDKHTVTTSTQTTATAGITLGGAPGVSTSRTFTVDYTGNVTLELGLSGTPAFTTYADYSGGLGSGTLTLTNGRSCGYDIKTFANVAPGTYTMTITLRASDSGATSVGACGQIRYPMIQTTTSTVGSQEFYYNGFEEASMAENSNSHTGNKCYTGDFTVSFTMPNTRTYVVEYWYLNAGAWQYISKPYTGTSMILSEGDAIDDVRIYPTDAFMKSYTYSPGIGMTSSIEENGRTLYYEYDDFGRLTNIRNENGDIEKNFVYSYKN